MLDQFISGFEFGSIAFIVVSFVHYCWVRSAPCDLYTGCESSSIQVLPSESTVTQSEPTVTRIAAKSIVECPTTSIRIETDINALKQIAKGLKVKNWHSYKSRESLQKAIEKVRQKVQITS